jgi:polysaccharide pyruvyl transferase WcaK-like protein
LTAGGLACGLEQSAAQPRIGMFGNLGSGNIGNDASMEAVLRYFRSDHPGAVLDAMCGGATDVSARYGIPAIPLYWYQKLDKRVSGVPPILLKVLGKGADVFRTAAWVRRHDVVIVPGMGVLEASLPLRPWGFPYAMFLLCVFGRLFGTKVALVSVGAGAIRQRLTRRLLNWAARLAFYRSYRDPESREAMQQRGLDTTRDPVYPDLAFYLRPPPLDAGDPRIVCVGVMAYYGSNDDRRDAGEIYSSYVAAMKAFVRWLVDTGRQVRLIVGDTNGSDNNVVAEILADLRGSRPDLDRSGVIPQPVTCFADVMRAIQPAGSVVAIRFHNVLGALRLCKPTIAISYSAKHDALMTDMGLPGFCRRVRTLDVELLIRQFTELQGRSGQIRQTLTELNARNERLLQDQFTELSAALFPAGGPARRPAAYRTAASG